MNEELTTYIRPSSERSRVMKGNTKYSVRRLARRSAHKYASVNVVHHVCLASTFDQMEDAVKSNLTTRLVNERCRRNRQECRTCSSMNACASSASIGAIFLLGFEASEQYNGGGCSQLLAAHSCVGAGPNTIIHRVCKTRNIHREAGVDGGRDNERCGVTGEGKGG